MQATKRKAPAKRSSKKKEEEVEEEEEEEEEEKETKPKSKKASSSKRKPAKSRSIQDVVEIYYNLHYKSRVQLPQPSVDLHYNLQCTLEIVVEIY
jgi:hypothetical protein